MKPIRVPGRPAGPKVVVGYPVGGSVTLPFHVSVMQLLVYEVAKADHERLLGKITHTSGLYVGDNRTMLAQRFMETDAEWLLQIDTDIEFPKTLLETMLGIVSERDADGDNIKILAANVPLGVYATVAFQETGQRGIWANYEALPADVFQCDAAATAVMLIHRDVLEGIAREHGQSWFHHMYLPENTEETDPTKFRFRSIGEDMAFCVRAKAAGFETWVARVPGLKHHKTRALSEESGRAVSMAAADGAMGELVREG